MADCNVSMFDYIVHNVKPLSGDALRTAYDITVEDGLDELLDFLVENGTITTVQSHILWGSIVMFEDFDGNYWEEDFDKYMALQDAVGLTREACAEFAAQEAEKEV